MLRVGLIGDAGDFKPEPSLAVELELHPVALPTCHLVIGAGAADPTLQNAADVWLDDPAAFDELWRSRVLRSADNLERGRRAPRRQNAVVGEPDPAWAAQAARLIPRLSAATGTETIRIDHIGSTSVPGLPAKNLIDIQIVVDDFDRAPIVAEAARDGGFVRVGAQWCADRDGNAHPEEVVVDADPGRPVNVNIRSLSSPIWRETLLFRDWLRAEPAARSRYTELKRDLAARPGHDVNDYGRDKIPWIRAAASEAEAWAAATGRSDPLDTRDAR